MRKILVLLLACPLLLPAQWNTKIQTVDSVLTRLYEQQRRNNERQQLLEQISRHLQQTLDSEVLIPLILEEVNKAIEAEAQSLWLLNNDTGLITCNYATGPGGEAIKKVVVPLGRGIVGSSVASQTAIMIEDAQIDERRFKDADAQTGFVTRSLLCVPLVRQGKSIGAIEAVNKQRGGLFGQPDLDLLRNIADSAALSIENARLYAELAASYDGTLDALTAALDLRDKETEGHSRRVVDYTARRARQSDQFVHHRGLVVFLIRGRFDAHGPSFSFALFEDDLGFSFTLCADG